MFASFSQLSATTPWSTSGPNRCGQRFKMRSGHDSKKKKKKKSMDQSMHWLQKLARIFLSVSEKSLTANEVKTTLRLVPTGSPSSAL